VNLSVPSAGLLAGPWADARALDAPALSNEAMVAALAAHDLLGEFGWPAVHERAAGLAAAFAERLRGTGREVVPRGDSTLVSWEQPDPEAAAARLALAGVTIRPLPQTPYLRASIGAWNDESDLERLIVAL